VNPGPPILSTARADLGAGGKGRPRLRTRCTPRVTVDTEHHLPNEATASEPVGRSSPTLGVKPQRRRCSRPRWLFSHMSVRRRLFGPRQRRRADAARPRNARGVADRWRFSRTRQEKHIFDLRVNDADAPNALCLCSRAECLVRRDLAAGHLGVERLKPSAPILSGKAPPCGRGFAGAALPLQYRRDVTYVTATKQSAVLPSGRWSGTGVSYPDLDRRKR
jgi:hypothetical protein